MTLIKEEKQEQRYSEGAWINNYKHIRVQSQK